MSGENTATLSAEFQIAIPEPLRRARRWRVGQEFALIPKGEGLLLVPVPSREELQGVARGAKPEGYREREDRF